MANPIKQTPEEKAVNTPKEARPVKKSPAFPTPKP